MPDIDIGWAELPREFETMAAEHRGDQWIYVFPAGHILYTVGGLGWGVLAHGQPPPSGIVVDERRPPYPQAFHITVLVAESGQPPQALHVTYDRSGAYLGDDAGALVGATSPAEVVSRVRPVVDLAAINFALAVEWDFD